MTLRAIGVGFARTGTLSLGAALRHFGFETYDMIDILFDVSRRKDIRFWRDAAKSDHQEQDWESVFGGFSATVGFPGAAAWRALVRTYPGAKVVLTVPPSGLDCWYESVRQTIWQGSQQETHLGVGVGLSEMMDSLIWNGVLAGSMAEPAAAKAVHREHIEAVKAEVPADRLLVFNVSDGWGPLREFFGSDGTYYDSRFSLPFPHLNRREETLRLMKRLALARQFTS